MSTQQFFSLYQIKEVSLLLNHRVNRDRQATEFSLAMANILQTGDIARTRCFTD